MRNISSLILITFMIIAFSACSAGNGVDGEGDLVLDGPDDSIIVDGPDLCVGPLCSDDENDDDGDADDADVDNDVEDEAEEAEVEVRRCEAMRDDVEEIEGDVADLRERLFAADGLVAQRDATCSARSCEAIVASGTIRSHEASKEKIADLAAEFGRCEKGDASISKCTMGANGKDDCWDHYSLSGIATEIGRVAKKTEPRVQAQAKVYTLLADQEDDIRADGYLEAFRNASDSAHIDACLDTERRGGIGTELVGGRSLLRRVDAHPIAAEQTSVASSSLPVPPEVLPQFGGIAVAPALVAAARALFDDGSACEGLETRLANLEAEKTALKNLQDAVKDETNGRENGCKRKAEDQCNEALRAQDDIYEAWKTFYGKRKDETTAIGGCMVKRSALVEKAAQVGEKYLLFASTGDIASAMQDGLTSCALMKKEFEVWKKDNVLRLGEENRTSTGDPNWHPQAGDRVEWTHFVTNAVSNRVLVGFDLWSGGDLTGVTPIYQDWIPAMESEDGIGGLVGERTSGGSFGRQKKKDGQSSSQMRCPAGYAISRIFMTKGHSGSGRNVGSLAAQCVAIDGHGRVRLHAADEDDYDTGKFLTLHLTPVGKVGDDTHPDDRASKLIKDREDCYGQFCAHWPLTRFQSACEDGVATGLHGYTNEKDTRIHELWLNCRPFENEGKYKSWSVEIKVDESAERYNVEKVFFEKQEKIKKTVEPDWDAWEGEGSPVVTGIRVSRMEKDVSGSNSSGEYAVSFLTPVFRQPRDLFVDGVICGGSDDPLCFGEMIIPSFVNSMTNYDNGDVDRLNDWGTKISCPAGHVVTGIAGKRYRGRYMLTQTRGVALRCTPIAYFKDSDAIKQGDAKKYMTWTSMKGTSEDGDAQWEEICENDDEVVVGIVGNRTDAFVRRVSAVCAPLTIKATSWADPEE